MSTPFLPLDVLDIVEALDRERRTDPRIVAAHDSAASIRTTPRQRIGGTLVRFGRWIEGYCPDMLPDPEATTT